MMGKAGRESNSGITGTTEVVNKNFHKKRSGTTPLPVGSLVVARIGLLKCLSVLQSGVRSSVSLAAQLGH